MRPPVDIRNREQYKQQMRDLLDIDPARTVAITVDMQRDYLDADVATAPVAREDAERVIGQTAKLLDVCRNTGIPVVHCYVRRRPAEAERGYYSSPYGRVSQQARLSQIPDAPVRPGVDRVAGTPNAELPSVLVSPEDLHVDTKRVMDSFHLTDLDMLLRGVFRADTLLITGINTDTCVYATTFAASNRKYAPVVISDCVASMRGADHHWMALELMSRSIAWVLSLDDLVAKLPAASLSGA